jgi:hypothetical protein
VIGIWLYLPGTFTGWNLWVFAGALIIAPLSALLSARLNVRRESPRNGAAEGATRSGNRPRGILFLGMWVVVPLILESALGCWLMSLNVEAKALGGAWSKLNVATFQTRLDLAGYSLLLDQPSPDVFWSPEPVRKWLIEQAPRSQATAVAAWNDGKFLWWPALKVIVFISWWVGVIRWVINRNILNRIFYSNLMPGATYWDRLLVASRLSVAPFLGGAIAGLLIYTLIVKILWPLYEHPYAIATIGPPLGLLIWVVAAACEVGILGATQMEDEREWWSRLSAMVLIVAVAWLVVFGVVLYVPSLVSWTGDHFNLIAVNAGLIGGWLVTAIGGVMAGQQVQ